MRVNLHMYARKRRHADTFTYVYAYTDACMSVVRYIYTHTYKLIYMKQPQGHMSLHACACAYVPQSHTQREGGLFIKLKHRGGAFYKTKTLAAWMGTTTATAVDCSRASRPTKKIRLVGAKKSARRLPKGSHTVVLAALDRA